MKRFSFDDCVEQGFLRRIPPSASSAESSLKASKRWLEEAEKALGSAREFVSRFKALVAG